MVIETGLGGPSGSEERLRRQVARAVLDAPDLPGVTISVGVATTELSVESPEALIARADQALYRAKREGRDRVVGALDP